MNIPDYSPEALRDVMQRHELTGARTASLVGVDSRTVRKWLADPSLTTHRDMPESAWRLLLLLTGETTAARLRAEAVSPPRASR